MKYVINEYPTRYYAGIELIGGLRVNSDDYQKIPKLWDDFKEIYLEDIPKQKRPKNFIGLEMYQIDFMESKKMDYFAMVEISDLFDCEDDEIVTKKLPAGKYISFTISNDDLLNEVEKVYKYIEEEQISIHLGFDVKEYDSNQNYRNYGVQLLLTFKLEE